MSRAANLGKPTVPAAAQPGTPAALARFGLSPCTALHLDPSAARFPDDLVTDAHCLSAAALSVFDAMSDGDNVPPALFAGLYLLRQSHAALSAALGLPAQGSEPQGGAR